MKYALYLIHICMCMYIYICVCMNYRVCVCTAQCLVTARCLSRMYKVSSHYCTVSCILRCTFTVYISIYILASLESFSQAGQSSLSSGCADSLSHAIPLLILSHKAQLHHSCYSSLQPLVMKCPS